MSESYKKWLEQLPPEEAAQLEAATKRPHPGLARFNLLIKKVGDGTATPEELAEYEEEMRPHREMRKQYGHGKFYDDRG